MYFLYIHQKIAVSAFGFGAAPRLHTEPHLDPMPRVKEQNQPSVPGHNNIIK